MANFFRELGKGKCAWIYPTGENKFLFTWCLYNYFIFTWGSWFSFEVISSVRNSVHFQNIAILRNNQVIFIWVSIFGNQNWLEKWKWLVRIFFWKTFNNILFHSYLLSVMLAMQWYDFCQSIFWWCILTVEIPSFSRTKKNKWKCPDNNGIILFWILTTSTCEAAALCSRSTLNKHFQFSVGFWPFESSQGPLKLEK